MMNVIVNKTMYKKSYRVKFMRNRAGFHLTIQSHFYKKFFLVSLNVRK